MKLLRNSLCVASCVAANLLVGKAFAIGTWSFAIVGINNQGYQMGLLDSQYAGDTSVTHAVASQSYSGLDMAGNQQTMTFQGETTCQGSFFGLHSYTAGVVHNTYNNPANPIAYNSDTNTWDPNGSPDTLTSLGFAGFDDILHFGGVLEAGYTARYYFHLSGYASGDGLLADLAVGIAGDPDESFFETGQGNISTTWVTASHQVNGITPQSVHVQFSSQFVCDTFNVADGSDFVGTANYSSTLVCSGIEMLDAQGNRVHGWTVTSDSGTPYSDVPEPMSLSALAFGVVLAVKRKTRRG